MTTITKPFLGRAGKARVKGKDQDAPNRDIGFEERRKIGNYISDLRSARGLTQEELGRALGVRNTYISAIELGRTSISPERYRPLQEALGAKPKEFGKRILRHYNPWLYAMLFDDAALEEELTRIPERLQDLRE
jgi:transcriptional regulator with XRE-family HTH domain